MGHTSSIRTGSHTDSSPLNRCTGVTIDLREILSINYVRIAPAPEKFSGERRPVRPLAWMAPLAAAGRFGSIIVTAPGRENAALLRFLATAESRFALTASRNIDQTDSDRSKGE